MKEVTPDLVERLAGEAAYGRGLAYFEEGAVLDLKRAGQKILASVQGKEIYQVTLIHTKRSFEGSCDCPASDNFDFCKHCVAAALVYIQEITQLEQDKSGPPLQRLAAYLKTLQKERLIEELSELIQADNIVLEQWSLRADAALGVLDPKTVRKRITAAIPYNRNLHRFQQVHSYFASVEILIDQLPELLKQFGPEQALILVDYTLTRINKALETIDDSGGFRLESIESLCQIHIDTFSRLDWPPDKLAEKLVDYHFSNQEVMYPGVPGAYYDKLGDQGLDYFQEILEMHWDKLPRLTAASDWSERSRYMRIADPLIGAAEGKGDIDSAIALMAKMANGLHDYMNISEYCLGQQRIHQANEWLVKAQKLDSPSYHREGLNLLQIKIWIAQGKPEKAYDLQWQLFHKDPSINNYQMLKQVAEQQKAKSAAGDCEKLAVDYLTKQITSTDKKLRRQGHVDSLVEIFLAEKHSAKALAIAEKHRLEPSLLLRVGKANKDLPDRALPIYVRYATNEVKRGNNQGYREAVDALKLAQSELGQEAQDKLSQSVVRILVDNKAKRKFVAMLREAFPEL